MTATLDHPLLSPGARADDPQDGGRPPRRAGGAVLVVLGLVVAAALVVAVALTVVGVLVRQQVTTRETLSGVDAAALDLRCSGDVSVVADVALAPGTAEVTWSEHWSTSRPRHGAEVVDGRLALSSADCASLSFGSSAGSDVALRLPEGATVMVENEVGDVTTSGATGDVTVTTAVGDVDVRDAEGAVTVSTDVGDVALSGRVGSADVDLGTGDVRVRSSTVPDDLRVESGVGDVDVGLPAAGSYDVSAGTGVGDTAVTVDDQPGAPSRIAVSVGFGDATVRPLG